MLLPLLQGKLYILQELAVLMRSRLLLLLLLLFCSV
jgi:hypothetical protein